MSLAAGALIAGCSTTGGSTAAGRSSDALSGSRAGTAAWSQALALPTPRVVSMADEVGQQALRDGRPEAAVEWFRRAAEANPDLVAPVNGEVVALARLGRYEEAQSVARQAASQGLRSDELDANQAWLDQRLQATAAATTAPVASAESPTQATAAPPVATPSVGTVRLEVSNGTGVLGLARRTAERLSSELGGPTARARNHGHFGVEQTELRLRPEMNARASHALARELARTLGVSVAIVRTSDLASGVDAQLVLGVDTQVAQDRRAGRNPSAG